MENKKKIARRLVAMAKMLVADAGDSTFTELTPIRFKPEGSTMNSLANARMIKNAGYEFVKGVYSYDKDYGNYKLQAFFRRDGEVSVHTFKGFSHGYGGEGPHGMVEFGEIFGVGLSREKVFSPEYKESLPASGTVDVVHAFG
jgi:hypothetical protein